jgi:tRNA pseudouridine38-40 synthase
VRVIPAGRTDSGVHARGQVVHFKIRKKIPLRNLHLALNSYLAEDLAVQKIRPARKGFHARFDAKQKIYSYRILLGRARSPLSRRHSYHYFHPLDVKRMRHGAKLLEGKHDFRSFQAATDRLGTTVRTLHRVRVLEEKPFVTLSFEGDGFLYNMIRNIVGTLIWLASGKISLDQFKKILRAKDRRLAGPTAPAKGLCLEKVIY